jgi:hypothetical protein
MATPIKRIEKDFLLKVLYDEQIPIMHYHDRSEYILILEKPIKHEMILRPDRPIDKLKARNKLDLMFNYRGQIISFTLLVTAIRAECIFCGIPELLYKNLDRSYSRISRPSELEVQFSFRGDRYNLSYPRIMEFEPDTISELFNHLDPRNISGLIEEMAEWIKDYASAYKMVIFKDIKPASTEERIIAETGKVLFLPSTLGSFPSVDPYPRKRVITGDMFKRYLESTGVSPAYLDEAAARYIRAKHTSGIFSDAWIPILFHEYVIGYIHIWINTEGRPPFDFAVIDTMYQFAKVLAYSLKSNDYFEQGKVQNNFFEGKVIDISVSGLLFAYPHSNLASSLLLDSELTVKLINSKRTVSASAKIVRRFKDSATGYFGCSFLDMAPEDVRFLFEFLYGRPFTDADVEFLYGKV